MSLLSQLHIRLQWYFLFFPPLPSLTTPHSGSLRTEQRQEVQLEFQLQVQGYVLRDYQVCEGVAETNSPAATG